MNQDGRSRSVGRRDATSRTSELLRDAIFSRHHHRGDAPGARSPYVQAVSRGPHLSTPGRVDPRATSSPRRFGHRAGWKFVARTIIIAEVWVLFAVANMRDWH